LLYVDSMKLYSRSAVRELFLEDNVGAMAGRRQLELPLPYR
jgi:hypothetical protein